MNWEAVFFDFDGVILDSVNVKTKAFAKMFHQYGPEVEKLVVDYHINNTGVSRFDKFIYYYNEILKKPISKIIIDELSQQFSHLVMDDVIASPYCLNSKETLEIIKKNSIPAYIVSGTPENEMKRIVAKKELSGYFCGVYGSPKKKYEICQYIINNENYLSQNCLFIGDAMSDYEAAKRTGIQFLGIVKEHDKSIFPEGTAISSLVTISVKDFRV